MAKRDYSADSASLPQPRSLSQIRPDVIGSSRVPATEHGLAPAGEALPVTPSSIG
jgi:hypothetical protein